MKWITEGFEAFAQGQMENGGQNLYVSKKGVLQRIFQYDINQDGYPDLLFANSQSMYERPPVHVYGDVLKSEQSSAVRQSKICPSRTRICLEPVMMIW